MVLGDPVVFWFLRLLLFAILFLSGLAISKSKNKSITGYLWIAIVAFALIEGLRWMRGTDYENYLLTFTTGESIKDEPLYKLFIHLIYHLKINPTFVFVFLSGLFIGCVGVIFKNYKYAALWGLPLIYLMLGYQAENLVRQYMAISFMGLAYYNYCLNNTKWMLVCLVIAPLIHLSALFASVVFLIFTWKRIGLVKVWILVGVYLAAFFLWNPEWLSNIAVAIGSLDIDESMSMSVYIENAEHHFTLDGSLSERDGLSTNRSLINIILYFLTDIALIIVGYYACRNNQKLVLLYYFSYIGIISQILFGDIQVLMRLGYSFSWMCPILVALVIVYNNYGKYRYMRAIVLLLLFARYAFYGIIRQIGKISMAEGCMFIWDK